MSPDSVNVSTLDGDAVDLDLTALEGIPEMARVLPSDPRFDEATLIWNGLIKKPALVIQPERLTEVVSTVDLARDHGLLASIKGGGHNISGLALADRGMTLDMSRMNDVRVDATRKVAHVGPGCLLAEFTYRLHEVGPDIDLSPAGSSAGQAPAVNRNLAPTE